MMETLRENIQTQNNVLETEAQKHNAMISERYNRLKNAVANQFAEDTRTEESGAENAYASVSAPEQAPLYVSPNAVGNTNTYAQTPTVTEYISRASSALFTTEKFERMQQPVKEQEVITQPIATLAPVQSAAVKTEAQYSLSSMAKIVMAAFACVIVAMMTLICVNTYAINQKRMRIEELETQKAELVERSQEIQRRIENATSEETIREYAESQGMVKSEN